MKTSTGSISTGDHLIIEIQRGLATMKNAPMRQLKTVPLTTQNVGAARADATARVHESAPGIVMASPAVAPPARSVPGVAVPVARPAVRSSGRATTIAMLVMGTLVVVCSGVAWSQRAKLSVAATPAATPAAPQAATTAVAEPAVGFAVTARTAAPAEGTPVPAAATAEAALPAPPTTGAGPSSPAPTTTSESAANDSAGRRPVGARPHAAAEPTTKPEAKVTAEAAPKPESAKVAAPATREPPKPNPRSSPPEKTASADEKKPAPASAPPSPGTPASVDAILQQQLKSAIP